MPDIYDLYGDLVKYAQHLENTLKQHCNFDDETIAAIRACYIKPSTRVSKNWEEGKKNDRSAI